MKLILFLNSSLNPRNVSLVWFKFYKNNISNMKYILSVLNNTWIPVLLYYVEFILSNILSAFFKYQFLVYWYLDNLRNKIKSHQSLTKTYILSLHWRVCIIKRPIRKKNKEINILTLTVVPILTFHSLTSTQSFNSM